MEHASQRKFSIRLCDLILLEMGQKLSDELNMAEMYMNDQTMGRGVQGDDDDDDNDVHINVSVLP